MNDADLPLSGPDRRREAMERALLDILPRARRIARMRRRSRSSARLDALLGRARESDLQHHWDDLKTFTGTESGGYPVALSVDPSNRSSS
jgi:hypothetical protein